MAGSGRKRLGRNTTLPLPLPDQKLWRRQHAGQLVVGNASAIASSGNVKSQVFGLAAVIVPIQWEAKYVMMKREIWARTDNRLCKVIKDWLTLRSMQHHYNSQYACVNVHTYISATYTQLCLKKSPPFYFSNNPVKKSQF